MTWTGGPGPGSGGAPDPTTGGALDAGFSTVAGGIGGCWGGGGTSLGSWKAVPGITGLTRV